jgi:hypothetical protein
MYISIHYQIEKLFFPFTAVQQQSHVAGTCTRKRFVEFVDDRLGWIQLRLLFCFARRSTLYAALPKKKYFQANLPTTSIFSVSPSFYIFSAGPFWIFHPRTLIYFFDVNLSALVDSGKFSFFTLEFDAFDWFFRELYDLKFYESYVTRNYTHFSVNDMQLWILWKETAR